MQETTIANWPNVVLWIIALAQIAFAFSALLIAFATVSLLGSLKNLIGELTGVAKEAKEKMPTLMSSFERR
jgi:hypothetical protein